MPYKKGIFPQRLSANSRSNYKISSDIPDNFQQLICGNYSGSSIAIAVGNSGELVAVFDDSAGNPFQLPLSAFGEMLTANLTPTIGWMFNYSIINTDLVTTATSGGNVAANNGKAQITANAGVNNWALIQTKRSHRYIPGLGTLVRFSAIFGTAQNNSTQYIGIGDSNNGFFFGYQGTVFGILRRRSGNDTEGWIPQSEWNGDKLDGTGPSGITLIPTQGNIYSIKYQWLGFGAIAFYIENPTNGELILAHRIHYANANTLPSIFNPTLPLYARVDNSNPSSSLTLETSAAIVFTEGIPGKALVTRNSAASTKSNVQSKINVLTIQNKTDYAGGTNNNRVYVQPDFLSVSTNSNSTATISLVKNASLGSPNWTDVSTNNSVMRYDSSATISGGTQLLSLTLIKTDTSLQYLLDSLDIFLNPGESLTVACSSTDATTLNASISWREFF